MGRGLYPLKGMSTVKSGSQLTWIPTTGTRDKGAFTGNKMLRKFTLWVDRLIGAAQLYYHTYTYSTEDKLAWNHTLSPCNLSDNPGAKGNA